MFGKLIKAEWRSARRVVGALCAVVLISGLVLGAIAFCMVRWQDGSLYGSDFLAVVFGLLAMAAVVAVPLACGASIFYTVWRFYKSRFTEEGYLTFTLPVDGHQLMLSSIAASVLEILTVAVATVAAVCLAAGLFLAALPWNLVDHSVWLRILDSLRTAASSLHDVAGELAGGMLTVGMVLLAMLMKQMLSVTIGAILAKKHPILMAIVVYYAIGFLQLTVGIFGILDRLGITRSTLGAVNGMNLVTVILSYGAMYFLTAKRLNLN